LEVTEIARFGQVLLFVRTVSVIGLESVGLVKPGDDVAEAIFEASVREKVDLFDGDAIVVSQKIVSKADGLLVDISSITPRSRARSLSKTTRKDARLVELILKDSAEVLRADSQALVVRRRDGMVCLNAGVDKSNVKGRLVYARLPTDADSSAHKIRTKLERLSGKRLGVIVADTYSRPLRVGQVEFAIGVSGMEPIVDYRGLEDLFGYQLRYKFVGLADEVAAAAELVMGQGTERTPVAVIRGLVRLKRTERPGLSKRLMLGKRMDLFRKIM
jgi:coenzyme F420-0:L-glutamate ligase/coenzyme F420-1:gamma-L-glutamate ligase